MERMMEQTLMMEIDALKVAQKSEFHSLVQNMYHSMTNSQTLEPEEEKVVWH
jgi:hypothetical protein